jgi:hypothetical protein
MNEAGPGRQFAMGYFTAALNGSVVSRYRYARMGDLEIAMPKETKG